MAAMAGQSSALAEQLKDAEEEKGKCSALVKDEEEEKGKRSALAEQPDDEEEEEGKGADDEPVHHKFNIGVFNWGTLRKNGEAIYARNVYNLPIFVGLSMGMTQKHVEQFSEPSDLWEPAKETLPMEEPLQGVSAGGSELWSNRECRQQLQWPCSGRSLQPSQRTGDC